MLQVEGFLGGLGAPTLNSLSKPVLFDTDILGSVLATWYR